MAVDLLLPPVPTSAAEARRLLRRAMTEAESAESLEAAQVAISEIVTNALVHAGTPMQLRVRVTVRGIRVELSDGSPHLPRQREYATASATGRGLLMVEEMTDRWGAYPDQGGKVVWFEITGRLPGANGSLEQSGRPAPPKATTTVELLNMPMLMHQAWQEHASGLLRELLLVQLDDDLSVIDRHASASDAMSLLFEQVPSPDIDQDAEVIMATATDPGLTVPRLILEIPDGSTAHFQVLDEMMIEALAMADRGELLSPPTTPEIRTMREWICDQVREQPRGARPVAWSSPTDTEPARDQVPLDFDPTDVEASPRAVVAADDANRIVAVSPDALSLLGYDDPAALVGRRLLAIIPARYHQAHVAGFTLHLVNGRDPLLGNRITVPVLRADGSEVELGLIVESQLLPSGRKVFTAEFFA